MMPPIYPWQVSLWQRMRQGQMPHAILLRGKAGIGKLDFATAWVKSLLCQTPQEQGYACGTCVSCAWFEQGNHPDFRLLSPEQEERGEAEAGTKSTAKTSKKHQIAVDQVRDLSSFLELSSHNNAGYRIVLIHPAEALNQASGNALLKMLEEPPAGVLFVLVTHQPYRILPTIMSRCHKVDMPLPDSTQALQWLTTQGISDGEAQLNFVGGAPLLVASEQEVNAACQQISPLLLQGAQLDVFELAPKYVSLGMESALNLMQKWIYDVMLCKFAGAVRYHSRYAGALQGLAEKVDLSALLDFQRKLDQARKTALHPLNQELQLEAILLDYTRLFSSKSRS
jgi:DNA polymerase III subunit delta'